LKELKRDIEKRIQKIEKKKLMTVTAVAAVALKEETFQSLA
jgi:hypothetical protein